MVSCETNLRTKQENNQRKQKAEAEGKVKAKRVSEKACKQTNQQRK